MTANLAEDLFGVNLALRKPAWHNLGEVFSDNPDLVTAFQRARLDYELKVIQSTFQWDDGNYYPGNGYEIVRGPAKLKMMLPGSVQKPISLGQVSGNYYILQNMFLAETFNDLSKRWPVESAGALGKGEKIFFTLDAGEVEINGQLVHQYFIGTDDKKGEEKTKLLYAPLVVVCQNTLNIAIGSAVFTVNIRHSKGNEENIKKVARLAEQMQSGVDRTNEIFGDMGKVHFSVEEFRDLLKYELYPEPSSDPNVMEVGEDGAIEVSQEFQQMKFHQEACVEVFNRYNDEHMANADTAWGALMAVSEYEQHIREGRGVGNYRNVLFGQRAGIVKKAFANLSKIS